MNVHFPLFKHWDERALKQVPEREFTAFTESTIYKPSVIATDVSYSLTMFPTIAIIATVIAGSIFSLWLGVMLFIYCRTRKHARHAGDIEMSGGPNQ